MQMPQWKHAFLLRRVLRKYVTHTYIVNMIVPSADTMAAGILAAYLVDEGPLWPLP